MSKISTWSKTASSNNSASPDGWPESMPPSGVNDSAREMMAQIRTEREDGQWFDHGNTPTYVSTTSFTVTGDQTTEYHVGRRIKVSDASTLYGVIATSAYTSLTTLTVTLDSGVLSCSISAVYLGILSEDNNSIPDLIATKTGTETLTNKTLDTTNTVTVKDSLFTLEDASDSTNKIVFTNATPFSNRTLTLAAGIIADATVSFPSATTTLVGRDTTDTLTNKTLTSPNINEAVALTSTATELNYVDGVTSAIQTQLDAKVALAGAETITGAKTFNENIIMQAANGIDMSANTGAAGETSSVLDWYEEGTFTPVLHDSGGAGGSVTYTTQEGAYTRIGNTVVFNGYMVMNSLGDLTGSTSFIEGLPFTVAATSAATITASSLGITASESVTGFITASGTSIKLKIWNNTVGVTDLDISEITAGGWFAFSGSYKV